MKKLIVGLVLVGLMFAPVSVVKAQVIPTDREAILAQLNLIYAQLVQLMGQLQAELAAQVSEQSNQITTVQTQNMATSKKIDTIVTNTTPSATPPVSEPEPQEVVKTMNVKVDKSTIRLNEESATFVVQIFHDGVPMKNIPFTVHSNDIVRNLNSEIGDLIAGRKLLIALDGKGIGGGRLTNLVASTAGSILGQLTAKDSGAVVQVISSLAGALGVKAFLRYIQSGAFGGPATERILSHLAENRSVLNELIAKEPQIVKNAWLKQIDDFIKSGPKLLNAPAEKGNRPFISGDKPIPLGGATTFEKQAPNVNYRNSLPPVPKDLAPKIGAISKDLEPLATEARKYKSAEDFVQSSGLKVEYAKNKLKVAEDAKPITVTVYHGSPDARFAEEFNPSKKGYFKDAPDLLPDNTQWNELYGSTGSGFKTGTGVYEGISFTDDFKVAKSYADKPAFDSQNSVPMVLERTVTLKKPKVIDVANGEWKISLERTIEQAKKEGYDGIIFKNIKDNYHPSTTQKPSNNIIVFSPDQLKTKSQLTDFYNKAVGKLPSKPPKLR